jgi:hypothetical protein
MSKVATAAAEIDKKNMALAFAKPKEQQQHRPRRPKM